ncbi:MAG: hypothetical protein HYT88_05585 [Candidatus Omnitrophica bacterium]|nr:hypothetical protein [Candidatus Omnitrophota bacterium]MBI2174865.1 hypothetical protein [Candidatus Omnitrophota bacterium]MBI3009498.1 hypothetical protein [Candidatus Omnitrophota bacterium]
MPTLYAATFLVNALFAFILAFVILARRTRNPIHLAYAFLLLFVSWWAAASLIAIHQTQAEAVLWWVQFLLYPACFVPTVMLHFALVFFNSRDAYRKHLVVGYILSALLVVLNANQVFLETPRPKPPLPLYPHGTVWLLVFIAIEVYYVIVTLRFAASRIKRVGEPLKTRIRYFLMVGWIGWPAAWSNWLLFQDAFPSMLGANLGVTFYLVTSSYLILKHDILGLNWIIRKTALYALLTLFLTVTYGAFIIISEKLLARLIGYSSLVGSLFAGLTVAVLFNPLRNGLSRFIDRTVFGKSIAELSTENMTMRHELIHAERMKAVATLAAGMAHEIKNPLTAIRIFAEYLPSRYDEPEFRHEFRDVVITEVERVNDILKQLLDFAKPHPLQPKSVSLKMLIEEIVHLLARICADRKIKIARHYEDTPSVFVDPSQMKQVVINLLMNAVQAMPEGGTLSLSVWGADSEGKVHLQISDTGIGIREEDLAHIFDPFFSRKEYGTGLGLAIAHNIVQNHGGAIHIASRFGIGTSVRVILPASSAPTSDVVA